jgi:hypothetical protein
MMFGLMPALEPFSMPIFSSFSSTTLFFISVHAACTGVRK